VEPVSNRLLLTGGTRVPELVAVALAPDGTPLDCFELELADAALTATCTAPAPVDAGLRVELCLPPADDPAWLVPGVFYGENRPEACTRIYPRFVPGRVDVARMESDAWSFRADRCSTPAVFARGGGLVTTESSPLGQSGVGFAWRDGRPAIWLDFPYREEPLRYSGSNEPEPPDVRTHRWQPGERATVAFARNDGDWARVLREASNSLLQSPAWVSVEEAAELAAWGLWRWHYRPEPARLIETAAFDRDAFGETGDRDAMHVSWVSGTPYAYGLLRHGLRVGDERYVEAARGVLDHCARNLTPGGTFWSQWTASRGWQWGWHPDHSRLHARTLGDATLFLLRAARLDPHPEWDDAVRSNLDVALRTQRGDGALPAAHDVDTGDAVAWEGSAGLAWIPALAEAGHLDEARAAAEHYQGFEVWSGAPEDVDLAPSSEDGYAAVMAFVAVEDWAAARRAADWMLTFRYTYDVDFSPRTPLGAWGFRTRGADQASPANQHLHSFGLIALPEMIRLARATGDDRYGATTRENLACFRQLVAREDGDFNAQRGMVSERYYQTDCFAAKGMLLTLSHAWSVGVLLYACEAALELGL
jgi:hypothetical protein